MPTRQEIQASIQAGVKGRADAIAADKANAQPVRIIDQPRVVVTDFDISFGNLFGLMLKIGIAAIPVLIVLVIIGFFIAGLLRGMIGV